MSVFKHKGGNIYYAGFGVGGRYFVRSLGTSNRREAERNEKKLRALAEAGLLPLKVSADERAKAIRKSVAIPAVSRIHLAKVKATARKRKKSTAERDAWIASIKAGQSDPTVKSKMDEARLRTNSDPKYRKRKSRKQKKVWKRRGHRSGVSKALIKTLATDESKERRRVGRERWARKLLGIDATAAPQNSTRGKRGRASETESRVRLAAAAARLRKKGPEAAPRLFAGKTQKSAEASYYDLLRRYRTEITALEAGLSEVQADAIWTDAVPQSHPHSP